jgi:hypothetical protein
MVVVGIIILILILLVRVSHSEELLHDICFAMKNEQPQGETSSRSVLAASIISDQPISELINASTKSNEAKEKKKKPGQELSSQKPKLAEGVTFADVFQWYNLSELQQFARGNSLKVSGKKKEIIHRILDFLAKGASAVPAPRKTRSRASSAAAAAKKSRSSCSTVSPTSAVFSKSTLPIREPHGSIQSPFSRHCMADDTGVQELLSRILKGCKAVNKPLTAAQIDECERKLKKTVRLVLLFRVTALTIWCGGVTTEGRERASARRFAPAVCRLQWILCAW